MNEINNLAITFNLDNLEKNILTYLLNNIDSKKNLQIRNVAFCNFTSTATVFKMSKKMGFSGYSSMIFSLKENYQSSNPVLNNLVSNLEIKIFNDYLKKYESKKIIVMGIGFSHHIASYFSERLILNNYNSIVSEHMQLLYKEAGIHNLLIVVSKSGNNSRLIELVEFAKKNGLDIISFCGVKDSKISKLSDFSIICNEVKSSSITNSSNSFFGYALLYFENLLTSTT